MKAIGFDLGSTLIDYENIPLSWKKLYREALVTVLNKCNYNIEEDKIDIGEKILLKYNTRINYREIEVSSNIIFSEILEKWSLDKEIYLTISKETFLNISNEMLNYTTIH